MKYTVALSVLFSLAFQSNAQQWYTSYAPHGRDVSASAIPSRNIVVLGGGFEVAPTFEDFFLSVDYGIIWNVNDGGGNPTSQVKSMAFKDSLTGYAVCYKGKIVRTADGGNTWTKIDTLHNRHLFKVIYVTPQTLFIAGGSQADDTSSIYKSVNGGSTWTVVYNQPGKWLKSVCFIDTLKGFAVGDDSQILETTDGGTSWLPVVSPVNDRNLNGVVFTNADTGYIIGGLRDSIKTILKTTDAGQNWNTVTDEAGGALNDVTFINPAEGYIVGDSATVLKTVDGGQNWMPQPLPGTNADQRINTVTFYNSNLGIIGGMGGFVRIFASIPPTQVITLNHTLIDTNNVTLAAKINTHGCPTQCYFHISNSLAFIPQNTLQYGSLLSNDSLVYFTTTVNGLSPNTTYYYFLKATNIAGVTTGDTLTFQTGFPAYTITTFNATGITMNSAVMQGAIEKIAPPVTLSFEYGTTFALSNSIPASPAIISDTFYHTVSASLNQLPSGTDYFYRLRAETGSGVFFSTTSYFQTAFPPPPVQTLYASDVTLTSAKLHGRANNLSSVTALSFDYGTNLTFSGNVIASPDTVFTSTSQDVSAAVSGLQGNVVYYFRLKGVAADGTISYGDTLQFYTTNPFIPNWDFENWSTVVKRAPKQWYYYGNADITTSYNGSKALYLYPDSETSGGVAFTGIVFPELPPLFGSPFTARPDSLIFFANYEVSVDDTAFGILVFRKNGAEIERTQFALTGNTGGSFIRKSIPLPYSSLVNPDTVMIAFASSVRLFNDQQTSQNRLKIDDISFSGTLQNVPNPNFENWDTITYEVPDFWSTAVRDLPVNVIQNYPVTKTTDAYSGQFAVRMQSMPVISDHWVSGSITTKKNGGTPNPDFPVSYRCTSFNGYYKFLPDNSDTVQMNVLMFKNGVQVGNGNLQLDTPAQAYTLFRVPMFYNDENVVPDSALIFIQNCLNITRGASVLYIDNLSFEGVPAEVSEVNFSPAIANRLKIYPNPGNSNIFIAAIPEFNESRLEIVDNTGKLVFSGIITEEAFRLNVSDFSAGIYLLKVSNNKTIVTSKMSVVK